MLGSSQKEMNKGSVNRDTNFYPADWQECKKIIFPDSEIIGESGHSHSLGETIKLLCPFWKTV